jgi:hypothetical protein
MNMYKYYDHHPHHFWCSQTNRFQFRTEYWRRWQYFNVIICRSVSSRVMINCGMCGLNSGGGHFPLIIHHLVVITKKTQIISKIKQYKICISILYQKTSILDIDVGIQFNWSWLLFIYIGTLEHIVEINPQVFFLELVTLHIA